MRDITLAIGIIGVLSVVGMYLVEPTEIVTVLGYCVTAIGSLSTGNVIGKKSGKF